MQLCRVFADRVTYYNSGMHEYNIRITAKRPSKFKSYNKIMQFLICAVGTKSDMSLSDTIGVFLKMFIRQSKPLSCRSGYLD